MELHEVNSGIKKFKAARRVGRGPGSGRGKTSSRGHKGAKSRAGYSRHPVFQGGAMPLVRQVPKRGFNNKSACNVVSVNIGDLEQRFEAGEEVTWDQIRLRLQEVIDNEDKAKPLSDDDLVKKLKDEGLNVARRTVTKYRKKMGIPSSRQRRDWSKR